MMKGIWHILNERERTAFRAVTAFLDKRFEERLTIDWALKLKQTEKVKRWAVLDLLNSPRTKIKEPWRSAWRFIEESWGNPINEDTVLDVHDVKHRISMGERSGSLINAIVNLVAPKLEIKPFSELHLSFQKPPKVPKKVEDLFFMSLKSGRTISPELLKLQDLSDLNFLKSLSHSLEVAVSNGLNIARRIGWDGKTFLRLGQLNRVYYEIKPGENEPDEFNEGIAPSVKLLYSAVSRIAEIDIATALEFVIRWKKIDSPVHLRLWAAFARDSRIINCREVASFLLSTDKRLFWNDNFPEIAELRSVRFNEFELSDKTALVRRIRQGPPRNIWPSKADSDKVEKARHYCVLRELKRIDVTGASLPESDKEWLNSEIVESPELVRMTSVDYDFPGAPIVNWATPSTDVRYDIITGVERLKKLEAALSSDRWLDSQTRSAQGWIDYPESSLQVIGDLETLEDGGGSFGRVWERLGWSHSPPAEEKSDKNYLIEATRVLDLLRKLNKSTVRQAIKGISHWLYVWKKQVIILPEGLNVWLKVWTIAIEVINSEKPAQDENETCRKGIIEAPDDNEISGLDTLNTPVGKLVSVFLAACPSVKPGETPFAENSIHTQMRHEVSAAIGPAGLIVKYRLIEQFRYFLKADFDWTKDNLVPPLLQTNDEALFLWRAVAHQTLFSEELKLIGEAMSLRALDQKLSREIRRSLVFSLVVECLHAYREKRNPVVDIIRVQQTIRSLDDEVRAYAAEAIRRFLRDVSRSRNLKISSAELFRTAVKPFLERVWPQERSLATPGVSKALADIPAIVKDAFAEAVDTIERFLVPFDCWSLHDYGLYGEEEDEPKLSIISDFEKASAFLKLLDLTIGKYEGSVIPHDLSQALNQIGKINPNLTNNHVFRRLATLARRS